MFQKKCVFFWGGGKCIFNVGFGRGRVLTFSGCQLENEGESKVSFPWSFKIRKWNKWTNSRGLCILQIQHWIYIYIHIAIRYTSKQMQAYKQPIELTKVTEVHYMVHLPFFDIFCGSNCPLQWCHAATTVTPRSSAVALPIPRGFLRIPCIDAPGSTLAKTKQENWWESSAKGNTTIWR